MAALLADIREASKIIGAGVRAAAIKYRRFAAVPAAVVVAMAPSLGAVYLIADAPRSAFVSDLSRAQLAPGASFYPQKSKALKASKTGGKRR